MGTSKKRGDGEGSIFKRADGRWSAEVSLPWTNEGRQRKTVYGKTRAEVVAKLDNLRSAVRDGKPITKDKETVRTLMESFLAHKKGSIRETTYRLYEQMVRNHIVPSLGGYKVSQLDARRVQCFLNNCQSAKLDKNGAPKELSAQTLHHIRAILRAALNDAID